jgi:hypothetical protein
MLAPSVETPIYVCCILIKRLRVILVDVVSAGCVAGASAVASVVIAVVDAAVIVAPAAAAIPWEPQRHF